MVLPGARPSDDEIRREIDRLYDVARESLASVWGASVAARPPAPQKALLERDELERDGVGASIGGVDIYAGLRGAASAPALADRAAAPSSRRRRPPLHRTPGAVRAPEADGGHVGVSAESVTVAAICAKIFSLGADSPLRAAVPSPSRQLRGRANVLL